MGLFKRISDIISANLGELVEGMEDPEKMLKQAVTEMEFSIEDATQETAKALAGEKKLQKELAHNQNEAKVWQSRAEKAVDEGNDQAARDALARKQEHDRLIVALEDQLRAAQQATQTLRHQLDAMKAKLSEAKRNLATLSARQRAAEVRKKVLTDAKESDVTVSDEAFAKSGRPLMSVPLLKRDSLFVFHCDVASGSRCLPPCHLQKHGNDLMWNQFESVACKFLMTDCIIAEPRGRTLMTALSANA